MMRKSRFLTGFFLTIFQVYTNRRGVEDDSNK